MCHSRAKHAALISKSKTGWLGGEVRYVLDQHAEFDFHSASSLKQQCADRHVAPLGHMTLIPSQPVLLLLINAACLALL
jgi:hypothetical protein